MSTEERLRHQLVETKANSTDAQDGSDGPAPAAAQRLMRNGSSRSGKRIEHGAGRGGAHYEARALQGVGEVAAGLSRAAAAEARAAAGVGKLIKPALISAVQFWRRDFEKEAMQQEHALGTQTAARCGGARRPGRARCGD